VTVLNAALNAALTAFTITWHPGLRGVLVVATGVVVLCGSVYLLLATNLGSRLGFLVAVAGLSGWMALMGFIWAVYGIGYKGTATHWKVEEVLTSQSADELDAAKLEKAHDLSKWRELPEEDPSRGEAQATAAAALTSEESRVKVFEDATDYEVIDAYTIGGRRISKHVGWSKPFGDEGFVGWLNGWLPGSHPPHYTIVQVQPVKPLPEDAEAGTPTEVDPSAPVSSVIMVRDLGKLRLPPVLIMLASLIVFGITCNTLHRRDKAAWAARAAAGA
jgi:hypothetical protein